MMQPLPLLAACLVQYQAIVAPVVTNVEREHGSPTIRTGTVRTIQYQAIAAPFTAAVETQPPPFMVPSRPTLRRGLHASLQQAWVFDVQWEAPAAVAVPDLPPNTGSDAVRRSYRRACYEPCQPEWGFEIRVPVMAWTGRYPDRLGQWTKRSHGRFMPSLFWDNQLFPTVVVPPDPAVPVYPDRVHRTPKLRDYPQPSWPPFVADVSVQAPALSWQPEFPDQIWPDRGLAARQQLAFTFDPRPIPVIAVSESTGRHRFTVPTRLRTFTAPPHRRKWVV